jgi:ribonuclease D
MTPEKNFIWIDSEASLEKQLPAIFDTSYLAIDLEADNQHLFEEQVCLVQISTDKLNFLIDTLAFKKLDLLKPVFENPAIPKIFHDLEFDLRSLNNEFHCSFKNLFDTKMAAEFCGEEKCSLSALLEKYLKLTLEKEYQQANWTMRPLSEKMLQYSVNDSCHLNELKDILTKQLTELNRSHWYQEECLVKENYRYIESLHPEFIKIKASIKLKDKQLNLLKYLCEIRSKIAKRNNISRFQILSNKVILEICMAYPNDFSMNYLHKIVRPEYKEELFNGFIDAYRSILTEEPLVHPLKKAKQKEFVNSNIDKIKKWRTALSEKILIPGVYLWPTETLEFIAENPAVLSDSLHKIPSLRQWQIQEFGDDFVRKLKPKLKQPH